MTFYSNVAPRRRIRPPREPWFCRCHFLPEKHRREPHPPHVTRCPRCGARRPD